MSSSTYSAAVAALIAAPRSTAARAASVPSACRASCSASRRRTTHGIVSVTPDWLARSSASLAASSVTASAGRPVAAHRYPHLSRMLPASNQLPVRRLTWRASRRCRAASSARPARRSRSAIASAGGPGSTGRRRPGSGPAPLRHVLGGGCIPHLDQHGGQQVLACAGELAAEVGRDLPGLPGESDGAVRVAGVAGGDG